MAYISTYATAAELSAHARQAYEELTVKMPLADLFPYKETKSSRYSFERQIPMLSEEAEYREFDAENAYGDDQGAITVEGALPNLGRNKRVTEFQQAMAWEQGNRREFIRDIVIEKARAEGQSIARRLERARVSALVNGSIDLSSGAAATQNNFTGLVDFGRDPDLVKAVDWSVDATATPMTDIEAAKDVLLAKAGVSPVELLVSGDVFRKLRTNKSLRDAYFVGAASVGDRLNDRMLESVLADETRLVIRDMTRVYAEVAAGTGLAPLWPNGKAVLLSPYGTENFGFTLFGVPVRAHQEQYGITAGHSGIIAWCYDEQNTPGLWCGGEAPALPIFPGVNRVAVLNVTV